MKFIQFSWLFSKAYSIAPLLVYPTHYTGEVGYISDTESSEIVPDIVKNAASKDSKPGKGSKEVDVEKAVQVELPAKGETGSVPAAAQGIEEISNIGNEFHTEL